jgi:hypothetical protein
MPEFQSEQPDTIAKQIPAISDPMSRSSGGWHRDLFSFLEVFIS